MNKKIKVLIIGGVIITILAIVSQSKEILTIDPIVFSDRQNYQQGEIITLHAFIFQPYIMTSGCYSFDIFDSDNQKLREYYYDCTEPVFDLFPYTLHTRTWDQKVTIDESINPDDFQRIQVEPGKYTLDFFDNLIQVTIESGGNLQETQKKEAPLQPITQRDMPVEKGKDYAIVTANGNGNIATFLKNGSSVIFNSMFATNLGYPQSIAAADFDGDGNQDIAVARGTADADNEIAILLGDKNGAFGQPMIFSIEDISRGNDARAIAIVTGDFNEDGKDDIVTTNSISKSISVLLNTTPIGELHPSFEKPKEFQVSEVISPSDDPVAVTIGDVNNDGHTDIITAHANSNSFKILLGNGDGAFSSRMEFNVGSGERTGPSDLGIADFNGDGYLDVVTANSISNEVSILFHTGTSVLYNDKKTSRFSLGGGQYPTNLVVADIDDNGYADIVTANVGTGNISIMRNNGSGDFNVTALDIGKGIAPSGIAIGNFDDGPLDIVTANGNTGTLSVLSGSGNGNFNLAIEVSAGEGNVPLDVVFVNFNP